MAAKISSLMDLLAWKEGHELVLHVYKKTKAFPPEEKFGLSNQMRRCVVSITSNIAEGFSRRGKKEKVQFLYMSLGSVTELQNQLLIAKDLEYITLQDYKMMTEKIILIGKLVNGLIKSSYILTT